MGYSHPPALRDHAVSLWRKGMTPTQVERVIAAEEEWGENTPSVSTIKSWIRGLDRKLREPPWRITMTRTADLATAGDVVMTSVPQGSWPTAAEVEWMLRIRALIPDLRGPEVYRLAVRATEAEKAGDDKRLHEIEYLLLMNPYDAESGRRETYLRQIKEGTIEGEFFQIGTSGTRGPNETDEDVKAQFRVFAEARMWRNLR